MPRGGARVGAGRKPKQPLEFPAVIEGGLADQKLAEPPDDSPEAHRGVWRELAPKALDEGTLTARTVPAFRLLCRVEAEIAETARTLDEQGRTYLKVFVDSAGQEHTEIKNHPLLAHYRGLIRQQQSLYKDFKLGPFGKPIAAPATNPNAAQQRQASNRAKFFGVAQRA